MFFLEAVTMVNLLFGICQLLTKESQQVDNPKLQEEMTMMVVVLPQKLMMENHNQSSK